MAESNVPMAQVENVQSLVRQIQATLPILQEAVTHSTAQAASLVQARTELASLHEQLVSLTGLVRDGTAGQKPLLTRVIEMQTLVEALKEKCTQCKAPEELQRLSTEVKQLRQMVDTVSLLTDFQSIRDRLVAIEAKLEISKDTKLNKTQWLQVLVPLVLSNVLTFLGASFTLQRADRAEVHKELPALVQQAVREAFSGQYGQTRPSGIAGVPSKKTP